MHQNECMKKVFLITCIFGLLTQANIGCNKEHPLATPYVIAREDIIIFLPMDTCSLWGTVTNLDINTVDFMWQKISGPPSYQIESPRSYKTKVSALEKGEYYFELTVTNREGKSGKDLVTVKVMELPAVGTNEIVFEDKGWECPWGCGVLIENFNSYVPKGIPIRVFIKYKGANNWIDVIPSDFAENSDMYTYYMEDNLLSIFTYSEDFAGQSFDVKINY